MDNLLIAKHFSLLAKLMELHEENPFKIKSYAAAADIIEAYTIPISTLKKDSLLSISGIGSAIADKIEEINSTGKLGLLEKYLSNTPPGLLDILNIKGLGTKKILLLWKELDIESLGELYYACLENRLLTLKGFGSKTQQSIIDQILFFWQQEDKILFARAELVVEHLLDNLKSIFPNANFEPTGEYRRKCETLSRIMVLAKNIEIENLVEYFKNTEILFDINENKIELQINQKLKIEIQIIGKNLWTKKLFETTSTSLHNKIVLDRISDYDNITFKDEIDIYESANMPFIIPELREDQYSISQLEDFSKNLIQNEDIKGVIHTHTTYSDGNNTIKEMADACKSLGYSYLAISDHSKSAFYANGLKLDAIEKQHQEIDNYNAQNTDFILLKSIESDILFDGSLDYEVDILKSFDVVIASIHSQLKMDLDKAMTRLVKAIENPFTHILGHATGRLLLSRAGYPLDIKKIIDACAANKVHIELNANPHRLDIDWRWIYYCMEKSVKISINPDAHSINGIKDIRYGVIAAQKGGLQKQYCLNALSVESFLLELKK